MDSLLNDDESNLSPGLSKKSPKNNEMINDAVVVTTTTAAAIVTEDNLQHRTRLPSFSSIIAGINIGIAYKTMLKCICS